MFHKPALCQGMTSVVPKKSKARWVLTPEEILPKHWRQFCNKLYTSTPSPIDRISSSALLVFTTPGFSL
jgi:hypothetical protein